MRCNFVRGTATGSSDGSGFAQTVTVTVGSGFHWATVVLNGWELNSDDERPVQRARIQIDAPSFNSATGRMTFTVSGGLQTQGAEDRYGWSVFYTILAFASETPPSQGGRAGVM